jgi:hypothetical protein
MTLNSVLDRLMLLTMQTGTATATIAAGALVAYVQWVAKVFHQLTGSYHFCQFRFLLKEESNGLSSESV